MDHVDIAPVAGEAQSGRDRPRCAAVSSGQGQQGQPGKVRPVPELPSFLCSALALTVMVILSRIQALESTNNNKSQCFFSLPTRSTLPYTIGTVQVHVRMLSPSAGTGSRRLPRVCLGSRIADDVMVHGGTYTVYLTLQTCGRDRRHVTGQVSCVKCQLGGRR